jgi:hypothetical protein
MARGTPRYDRLWRDKVSVSFPPRPIPALECVFPLPPAPRFLAGSVEFMTQ